MLKKLTHGAYILARFSTDNQNADTIEVQVEKCTEYCKMNKIPVLDVFADFAVSGMKDDRPQFNSMMQKLRRGGADTVVIFDQSRMFRKLTKWFEFREEIQALGVSVISVTQPQIGGDINDPGVFVAEGAMALFNQMWVLQTRQKVVEKMRYMAKNGLHTGGTPPLGYDVEAKTVSDDRTERRLVINETEAETVRFIFREYASGTTYKQIIEKLNERGMKTKSGGKFGINSIHDLLKNEKYIGVVTYGKVPHREHRNSHSAVENYLRIENACPVIVDADLFEKVQKKMEQNKKAQAGRPASVREYPLKGKVFCGECGAAMFPYGCGKEHKYRYYSCTNKKNKGECDNKAISCDALEQIVADIVRGALGSPSDRNALARIITSQRSDINSRHDEQIRYERKQLAETEAEISALMKSLVKMPESDVLLSRLGYLEGEKKRLTESIYNLAREQSPEVTDKYVGEIIDAVCKNKGFQSALFSLVARVEVSKESISVWTILDLNTDGTLDKISPHKPSELPQGDLLDIVGVAPPAPRIFITGKSICIFQRVKR